MSFREFTEASASLIELKRDSFAQGLSSNANCFEQIPGIYHLQQSFKTYDIQSSFSLQIHHLTTECWTIAEFDKGRRRNVHPTWPCMVGSLSKGALK